jgi:hypothetical protein
LMRDGVRVNPAWQKNHSQRQKSSCRPAQSLSHTTPALARAPSDTYSSSPFRQWIIHNPSLSVPLHPQSGCWGEEWAK